ncbi:hypothetical protein [Mesorhizobium sp. M0767]|uniref:hypothetical protein n=1 Tax=Mesorhizobium sp. M0767 TaxID=2956995 RepID=UPI0033398D88
MDPRKPQPIDPIAWWADLVLNVLLGGLMGAALGTSLGVAFGSYYGIVTGLGSAGVFIAILRD